jgi:hypothetical protein
MEPEVSKFDFQWDFDYRHYAKNRMIQLKPTHDKHIHFSLAWAKPKNSISKEDFAKVNEQIKGWLDTHNWKLTFKPIRACENCTYGYFDEEFELLLLKLQKEYSLCQEKELPVETEQHKDVLDMPFVTRFPIFMHISHSRSSDKKFNEYLQTVDISGQSDMILNIKVRK